MQENRDTNKPDNESGIEGLPVIRPNVAGIDLGSETHWVCAPKVDRTGVEVETFGATTPELERMAEWLKERKIESVAMESTGVYWIAPHEVLERHGLEVVLVNTRELARVCNGSRSTPAPFSRYIPPCFSDCWLTAIRPMARGRDRIPHCVGRTRYPARKSIRKAPAQETHRGIFAF
jgi:hypothetical protein